MNTITNIEARGYEGYEYETTRNRTTMFLS